MAAHTNNYPKLHNAAWPGLVGKGPDSEPPIDLDTMINHTAAITVKVVAEGLASVFGDTEARPKPEPSATRRTVRAVATAAPPRTGPHAMPDRTGPAS